MSGEQPSATSTGGRAGAAGRGTPLGGVLPVFQTPLRADEMVDPGVLRREIEWLYACGADGIVMAMVSETLRFSAAERKELAELACRFGGASGPVIISVGAESSKLSEDLARHAQASGAAAVMAIPPVSVAVDEAELVGYYERILAAAGGLPLIVQDASGYVGRPMSIGLQAELLARHGPERVLFKPEAQPLGPRLSALLDATGGRARIFEGTGGIALVESFRRGIVGTMPGADLVAGIVALWRALRDNDLARIDRLQPLLTTLVAMQTSLDAFLAVEKHLLVKQGVFENTIVRGPVGYRLDDATRREIDRLFDLLLSAVRS